MSVTGIIRAAIVAIFLLACAGNGRSVTYPISIQPGLEPRMSPAAVVEIALAQQRASIAPGRPAPTVTAVECVHGRDVGLASPPPAPDATAPYWIVRMTGRFVNLRTPPGVPAQVFGSGFYVIDDASGEAVGRGGSGPALGGTTESPARLIKGR
jgi:hypothetical protein